jgi:phage recombination protein Bet
MSSSKPAAQRGTVEKSGVVKYEEPIKGKVSLMARIAARYSVDSDKMSSTLKSTAFKPVKSEGKFIEVSDEQLMALLIVADQYHLNPFTREIYAFPAKGGGIVPVVAIDGWIRIINSHPQFDYMEQREGPENEKGTPLWIETEIKRHDRSRPTLKKERYSECYRNTDPWNEMPTRMLGWKSMAQCARVAFGFAGIYDPDEAERIANAIDVTPRQSNGKPMTREPQRKSITPPAEDEVEVITLDQATALADKLKAEGVALNLLLAKFEVGSLEELPAENYEAALDAIDGMSAE